MTRVKEALNLSVTESEEAVKEDIRETTWNLCKKYDAKQQRRSKTLLSNFITTELERLFGAEIENDFRHEWQAEVQIFCEKYGYTM